MTIILASASPRRTELLQQIGLEHVVSPSDIDESALEGEPADEYVQRMAKNKALVANKAANPEDVVIAADTTVSVDGNILGKPRDEQECLAMLASL